MPCARSGKMFAVAVLDCVQISTSPEEILDTQQSRAGLPRQPAQATGGYMKKAAKLTGLACVLAMPGIASAVPVYDTFGPLTGANFGGTGIPNDTVAISSQFYDGDNLITVAMNATQRYDNPVVTNNGAGTFYAGTGSNIKGPGAGTLGALWNWNYYIKVDVERPAEPDTHGLRYRYLLRLQSGL
jgi:hypothetical protein